MPRADLDWALHEFRNTRRRLQYDVANNYYDGQHDVLYDDRKFKSIFNGQFRTVRANICQVVVDSLTDRLEIVGFESPSEDAAARSAELWDDNRMDLVANEVHREAFKAGDSYVIVQPDDTGTPRFWFQPAEQVAVSYSDTNPGEIVVASKLWFAKRERRWRLNLYYADHFERYVLSTERESLYEADFDSRWFVPYPAGTDPEGDGQVPWAYGQVPVFHFANRCLYDYGYSELTEIVPLQKAINKTINDMLVTSEFSSFKQRYVTGLDPDELSQDEAKRLLAGVDRMMVASDPQARFGEFSQSDLGQFLNVIDHLMRQVARISGIPLHFIYEVTGNFPSGDALKTAEARFVKKLNDRQTAFGNVWEQVLRFALRIDGVDDAELEVDWVDTAPQSAKEQWEVVLMKKAAGVPLKQLFLEAGYTDEQADEWATAAESAALVDPAAASGSPTAEIRANEQIAGESPSPVSGAVIPVGNGRIQVGKTSYVGG